MAINTFGQVQFKGTVSNSDGKPVEFANVFVLGTALGTTTDSNGHYQFSAEESDTIVLMVKRIGYKNYKKSFINQSKGTVVKEDIILRKKSYKLENVVVSSYTNIISDQRKTTAINSKEIKRIPGSNDDITQGLRSLPGVQHVGEDEGLFIRGGDKTETKIYIDGLEMPVFYRNGSEDVAQRSWLSPNLFDGTFFSSGGYSALYGDALSGALILDSKSIPRQNTYDVRISSVGTSSDITLLSDNKRWMINPCISYMNLQPYYNVVEQNKNYINEPQYTNLYLNGRYKPNDRDILKLFFAGEKSNLSFTDINLDYTNYDQYYSTHNSNIFSSLVYEKWFGDKTKLYLGSSYSWFRTNEKHKTFHQTFNEEVLFGYRDKRLKQFTETRLVVTRFIGEKIKLRVGADWQYNDFNQKIDKITKKHYHNVASFSEFEWSINSQFITKTGIRFDYNDITNNYQFLPRFSAVWIPRENAQLLFSYGQYTQIPRWDYITGELTKIPRSSHYIFTYLQRINSLLFRIEGYYKNYHSLVTLFNNNITNEGSGYARGVDLFFRQNKSMIGNFEYWLSYSYLDTKRKYLHFPIKARPKYAAEHTLSLVTKKYIPAISCYVAGTYSYASGRPYYNPNLSDDNFLSQHTRDYHNLDFLIANILTINDKYSLTSAFTISNPFNWKHVFGYKYSSDGRSRISITPPASQFYYLGFYLNWGQDNSEQVIDDLLN